AVGSGVTGGGLSHRLPASGDLALDLDRNARRAVGEGGVLGRLDRPLSDQFILQLERDAPRVPHRCWAVRWRLLEGFRAEPRTAARDDLDRSVRGIRRDEPRERGGGGG